VVTIIDCLKGIGLQKAMHFFRKSEMHNGRYQVEQHRTMSVWILAQINICPRVTSVVQDASMNYKSSCYIFGSIFEILAKCGSSEFHSDLQLKM
jgi:hypothetical protein